MRSDKTPYEAVYSLRGLGWHPDFKSAFYALHRAIQDDVDRHRAMHPTILHEATWIDTPDGVMFFEEAKERAYREGLLKDGRLAGMPEQAGVTGGAG